MNKKNDPQYLRDLLSQCLDFWASPEVQDMPDIDFFDEIVRATNWKPKPEVEEGGIKCTFVPIASPSSSWDS